MNNAYEPSPLIKQGHGISRANFAVSSKYISAVLVGPIVIFALGFIAWIVVFWMTGLSLRFCRPSCGKWCLSLCIQNREKFPQREERIVLAFNIFLVAGFVTNMLSFIGNGLLDQAFRGLDSVLRKFNVIFKDQLASAAGALDDEAVRLKSNFMLASVCEAIQNQRPIINDFSRNSRDLRLSVKVISDSLDGLKIVLKTALDAKNAVFYIIWLFLLISIVLLKCFMSAHLLKTMKCGASVFSLGAKPCGRKSKTAIMAFVIITFFLIMLGCLIFMLTASGASDVCMDPITSAVSILPEGSKNQSAQQALRFYSTCSGRDVIGYQVNSTYDSVTSLRSAFVAAYDVPDNNCGNKYVSALIFDMDSITKEFRLVDSSRKCGPIREIWMDLQNTLCTNLFGGAYALWLTMLFSTVFVYCAFLLAAIDQYERVLHFADMPAPEEGEGDAEVFDGVKPEDLQDDISYDVIYRGANDSRAIAANNLERLQLGGGSASGSVISDMDKASRARAAHTNAFFAHPPRSLPSDPSENASTAIDEAPRNTLLSAKQQQLQQQYQPSAQLTAQLAGKASSIPALEGNHPVITVPPIPVPASTSGSKDSTKASTAYDVGMAARSPIPQPHPPSFLPPSSLPPSSLPPVISPPLPLAGIPPPQPPSSVRRPPTTDPPQSLTSLEKFNTDAVEPALNGDTSRYIPAPTSTLASAGAAGVVSVPVASGLGPIPPPLPTTPAPATSIQFTPPSEPRPEPPPLSTLPTPPTSPAPTSDPAPPSAITVSRKGSAILKLGGLEIAPREKKTHGPKGPNSP